MSRWRLIVVACLLALPFLTLAGAGSYYLWSVGLGFYVWWPMTGCLALGYALGWYWQRQRRLLHAIEFTAPLHWTERDRQAWTLVEARAHDAVKVDPDRFTDLQFFVNVAKEMAEELAGFYHPGAKDPVGALTIAEILAVIELVASDLAEVVDRYLPGGQLLSVNNWRQARRAVDWYQTASNVYWLVSALFSPLETGLRFVASKAGLGRPWQGLQQNLLVWFYTAFVHRVGTHLIEVNSGRLRVGARRYRELMQAEASRTESSMPPGEAADPAEQVRRVTLTLFGQVKVGKSSFANALLGEQRAATDVLPATGDVTRYELQSAGIPSRLVLLDTVGYAHTGPKVDQLKATQEAAQQSDLLVLVLHARNPGRQADLEMLQDLRDWCAGRPHLRMPPILAVLTHIDLLTPAMEWSPPYDWLEPRRAKEVQIAQAVAGVRDQLGPYVVGVVPVCAAERKVYGVNEWLLPALTRLLDEAHAVALLRCLRTEIDTGKVRKVFQQMLAAGAHAAQILWRPSEN